jgi:hypothetical protein
MQPRRPIIRSIGAILAGVVFIAVLSTVTDAALHAAGIYPAAGQPLIAALWLLALAYRLGYAIASGYLTAKLAPRNPLKHTVVLGCVGTALSLAGAIATWNAGPGYGPKWFSLGLVVTALPCTWTGGRLFASRNNRPIGPLATHAATHT